MIKSSASLSTMATAGISTMNSFSRMSDLDTAQSDEEQASSTSDADRMSGESDSWSR